MVFTRQPHSVEDKCKIMEPITSQPTNNFGFQDGNKGEGYVHGKNSYLKNKFDFITM